MRSLPPAHTPAWILQRGSNSAAWCRSPGSVGSFLAATYLETSDPHPTTAASGPQHPGQLLQISRQATNLLQVCAHSPHVACGRIGWRGQKAWNISCLRSLVEHACQTTKTLQALMSAQAPPVTHGPGPAAQSIVPCGGWMSMCRLWSSDLGASCRAASSHRPWAPSSAASPAPWLSSPR